MHILRGIIGASPSTMENYICSNFTTCHASTIVPWTVNFTSNATTFGNLQVIPNQSLSIVSKTILMMLCSLAILENVFTCYLIYTNQSLHTPTNTFISSLCITDMLCAGVLLPIAVFCKGSKAYLFLSAITVFTYTANLTAVTYERLISITKPLLYRSIITKKMATRITVLAWLIPILFCLLPIAWNANTNRFVHKVYIIFALLVFLVSPLFFICFVYIRISVEVHHLLKEGRNPVAYSTMDDSKTICETLVNRLRILCLPHLGKICWRRSYRKKTINRCDYDKEDSNDDISYTCKLELVTSTKIHESPEVPRLQSRSQDHVALRHYNNEKEGNKEFIAIRNEMITSNKKVADESAQDDCRQETLCSNAQVKTNAQVIIQRPEEEMKEQNKIKSSCEYKDANIVSHNPAPACMDLAAVVDNESSPDSIIRLDTFYPDVKIATKSFIREDKDMPRDYNGENSITLESFNNFDNSVKNVEESKEKLQQKVTGRRKRSFRRRQILDEMRASVAFVAVAFTYMFTWIPVIYMTFMEAIDKADLIPQSVDNFNIWTIALNATVDPLFYALILRNFRKVIRKKFRKMRKRFN